MVENQRIAKVLMMRNSERVYVCILVKDYVYYRYYFYKVYWAFLIMI